MNCLKDDFSVLRTNAIQRRRFQSSNLGGSSGGFGDGDLPRLSDHIDDDDSVRLLRNGGDGGLLDDPEMGAPPSAGAIPGYVGRCEALQYQMTRLEGKIVQLESLHKRHLSRPTLDDESKEEEEIRTLTTDITEMFSGCHQQIKSIRRSTVSSCQGQEAILTRNMTNYLVNRLQDNTTQFSQSQSDYLKRVKSREEKSKLIHLDDDDDYLNEASGSAMMTESSDNAKMMMWSKNDVFLLEENSRFVQQREKEIQSVVKSISDLNVIFKDLASMISEQGQVIDRIDMSIEQTSIKVEQGLKQLKSADTYHKKNRKLKCIVIEAVIVVILLLILIISKS